MLIDITSSYLLKPIERWMNDDCVSEIILNTPKVIFVERLNHFERIPLPEFDEKRLFQLFRLIANENQQELNTRTPILSGVLQNGSRIQLIIPPVSPNPVFSIRLKRTQQRSLMDLSKEGYFNAAQPFSLHRNRSQTLDISNKELVCYYRNQEWAQFIALALVQRKNIVISGATSSGKTTFLNACLNAIPAQERLVILEDTPEIQVRHNNSLRLLAYKGQKSLTNVTMQDLVQCSLRLRPDRIIVGEVRGKELLDYVGASLTGHCGSITTIHAENPKIAFIRMCQMYKLNALPAMTDEDIYKEMKEAVDIIFQLKRTPSGRCLDSVYFKMR